MLVQRFKEKWIRLFLIIFVTSLFTTIFYLTKYSSYPITIITFSGISFVIVIIWYSCSTTIVRQFQKYIKRVSTKIRVKINSGYNYRFFTLLLLIDLIVIFLLISFTMSDANITLKSSISFMIFMYAFIISIYSLCKELYDYKKKCSQIKKEISILESNIKKNKKTIYLKDLNKKNNEGIILSYKINSNR